MARGNSGSFSPHGVALGIGAVTHTTHGYPTAKDERAAVFHDFVGRSTVRVSAVRVPCAVRRVFATLTMLPLLPVVPAGRPSVCLSHPLDGTHRPECCTGTRPTARRSERSTAAPTASTYAARYVGRALKEGGGCFFSSCPVCSLVCMVFQRWVGFECFSIVSARDPSSKRAFMKNTLRVPPSQSLRRRTELCIQSEGGRKTRALQLPFMASAAVSPLFVTVTK